LLIVSMMRVLRRSAIVAVCGAVVVYLRRDKSVICFGQARRYARPVAERIHCHRASYTCGIGCNQSGCGPSPHSPRKPHQHRPILAQEGRPITRQVCCYIIPIGMPMGPNMIVSAIFF
jgi:hypothetical protein